MGIQRLRNRLSQSAPQGNPIFARHKMVEVKATNILQKYKRDLIPPYETHVFFCFLAFSCGTSASLWCTCSSLWGTFDSFKAFLLQILCFCVSLLCIYTSQLHPIMINASFPLWRTYSHFGLFHYKFFCLRDSEAHFVKQSSGEASRGLRVP